MVEKGSFFKIWVFPVKQNRVENRRTMRSKKTAWATGQPPQASEAGSPCWSLFILWFREPFSSLPSTFRSCLLFLPFFLSVLCDSLTLLTNRLKQWSRKVASGGTKETEIHQGSLQGPGTNVLPRGRLVSLRGIHLGFTVGDALSAQPAWRRAGSGGAAETGREMDAGRSARAACASSREDAGPHGAATERRARRDFVPFSVEQRGQFHLND